MKNCKYCQNEIPDSAKKCGHCHEWQKWYFNHSIRSTALFVLLFLAMGYTFTRSKFLQPTEDFVNHSAELKIIHHKFVSVEDSACQGKRHQAIVGTIKNTGNFDWQHFKLEIKLQNESGDLLDGTQVDLYSLTVPANSECIFRAPIESLKLPAGSKNYSISIVTASNNNIF